MLRRMIAFITTRNSEKEEDEEESNIEDENRSFVRR